MDVVNRCLEFDSEPGIAAFRHLKVPPDSASFSYATEGALFISAQLSIQRRRGQRPPKGSGTNQTQLQALVYKSFLQPLPYLVMS